MSPLRLPSRHLLTHGARIGHPRLNPLLEAAARGHFEVVQVLVKAGAMNEMVKLREMQQTVNAIKLSNVDISSLSGPTLGLSWQWPRPRDTSTSWNYSSKVLQSLMCTKKLSPESQPHSTAAGVNVNSRDSLGNTPLIRLIQTFSYGSSSTAAASVTSARLETAEFLMAIGAGVDMADGEGRTPLWWAANIGEDEVTGRLCPQTALSKNLSFGPNSAR